MTTSTNTLTVTTHALRAMLDRDVSPGDLRSALVEPEQRFRRQPDPAKGYPQPRTVHQWRDLAVVTTDPDGLVLTVLYRRENQWSSSDGRPSGRKISRATRRRLEAALRAAARAGADTVTLGASA